LVKKSYFYAGLKVKEVLVCKGKHYTTMSFHKITLLCIIIDQNVN
jgi:hypothetical protein